MDKAALYLRLSKEDLDKADKGDDSESILNQRLLLTDYAIEHDFQVVQVYVDDDYSGMYDDRPAFEQLIQDAKSGEFNIIIAKSQSRFTRNMEHMEKYLHHDFPLLGIRFIGIVDGADTNVKGNKKARQIYGLTNEWYCEDLSDSIRSVFKQKMKAGQFLGSFAPYGYRKDPADNHKLIIDETAAKVVMRIFQLYLQGYSLKHICHRLEDDEIPTPTVYKKQQGLNFEIPNANEFSGKYNYWSTSTLKRILSNETYTGKLIQGRYEKVSYKDKKVVETKRDKWIIVDNSHEAIIDDELFSKVEALRAKRRIIAANQTGGKKVHVLAGKLRCQTCGSTIIKSGGVKGNPKDWYLRCQLANKSRRKECTSHSILYSTVENTVLTSIQNLVNPILKDEKDDISHYISRMANTEKAIQEKTKKLKDLQTSMEDTAKSIKLLYLDRVKGRIKEEMFCRLNVEFEDEGKKYEEREKKVSDEIKQLEKQLDQEQQFKHNNVEDFVSSNCDYSKLTNEMVADFIDYIEIGERNKERKQQEIMIHWNL
ncbi:recombinase family protein [Lachnospiraceae bacterium ZAX-1]